jgi:hypothetical protein
VALLISSTVATGLLRYYLTINGIELDDNKSLSAVTFKSETTIDFMMKRISEKDT